MPKHSSTTITGNLANDPELRFTANGQAVAQFRMAVGDRYVDKETGEWKDSDPTWYSVIAWRNLAEHISASLTRGNRVIVTGSIRTRQWDDKEGETHYAWELVADEVGASLAFADVKVMKAERETPPAKPAQRPKPGNKAGGHPANQPAKSAGKAKPDEDPWADEPPF
jgi:single-strand DNA-binding protein